MAEIASVELVVGLEIHVELATRTKMFTRVASPAHPSNEDAPPNTLIDPTVLALPGALPVMNEAAIEMSMMVGLALGCSIAPFSKWDRKSYFYPDLPKAYQISQYGLPLCFDGVFDLPAVDGRGMPDFDGESKRIGIVRAHLEEDAGKLLHEAPGGKAIDFSIVDLNRAGTPLLEIVTAPDFRAAEDVVLFARMLRNICRFLGVSEGVMQKGHMRFEPNINTVLTLNDGRVVKTPITEVKNLNSFRAVDGAIRYELREQPKRWMQDGREFGPGQKQTHGWDDERMVTVLQREKEDAHDYRYFPDPDLLPVVVDDTWRERVRSSLPELPNQRMRRYMDDFDLGPKEAAALVDERDVCFFYESCITAACERGVEHPRAGKQAANMVLQYGAKRANERGIMAHELPITPEQIGGIIELREDDAIGSTAADDLFGLLCGEGDDPPGAGADPKQIAEERGMLIVRDEGALDAWCDQVINENPGIADDIRNGKVQAVGRLIGAVMKLSGGSADAKGVRERLLEKLGV